MWIGSTDVFTEGEKGDSFSVFLSDNLQQHTMMLKCGAPTQNAERALSFYLNKQKATQQQSCAGVPVLKMAFSGRVSCW